MGQPRHRLAPCARTGSDWTARKRPAKDAGNGKRLYHLSNLGLHLLARHLEKPARQLAQSWQADEVGLLRRLSRLPTLLVLQKVVNGLVDYAADAMTTQGQRPLARAMELAA